MPVNDNDALGAEMAPPDSHGQAALLLVEGLIHGLVARSVLKVEDALDILDSAATVQVDIAEVADGAAPQMWHSHALITAIADSLRIDS